MIHISLKNILCFLLGRPITRKSAKEIIDTIQKTSVNCPVFPGDSKKFNIPNSPKIPRMIWAHKRNIEEIIKSIEKDKYDYNKLNKFIKKYINYN